MVVSSVVVVIIIVVTGMTVGASVVGGPVGACVCATVKLREGAAGGSVGLAVILGGPGNYNEEKRRTFKFLNSTLAIVSKGISDKWFLLVMGT